MHRLYWFVDFTLFVFACKINPADLKSRCLCSVTETFSLKQRSLNATHLINPDPSAAEETSREQNRRRLPYIELRSETQCVRVLLSLHENGECTKTCVSGRTEQLTQLFLQILLRGSNRQPLNNKLRHETVSCASQRDTLTDLRAPNFTDILHLICQRKY